MKLSKVSDRVYANWDGETGGNVGIVVLDDRVLVVDAQYPGSARRFRESITKVTDKPLSHLLLTHCLLYTSPSPRDRTRSRMPSSA